MKRNYNAKAHPTAIARGTNDDVIYQKSYRKDDKKRDKGSRSIMRSGNI
ncbi:MULTISPECIES: hypothetical protein [unclassified Shewanella]